jgi:hydroxymethylbilane synthase
MGTRGSVLARTQSGHVVSALCAAEPGLEIETVIIRTTGDEITDRPLAEIGGKGLFVKEIEVALLEERIDFAVHSMKDVPAEIPAGLLLAATPAREDPRDALISAGQRTFTALPPGARIGTSSVRRVCQMRAHRPDLVFEPLRGNVDTRLRKLREGLVDAIVLAAAGLRRLGQADVVTELLSPDVCLPAIGQGILAIETRKDDTATRALVGALHDAVTSRAAAAERAFLARLGGDCKTPLAAHATESAGTLRVRGLVASLTGPEVLKGELEGPAPDDDAAAELGAALAERLLAAGAAALIR